MDKRGGEVIIPPGPLPQNWGPIFGLPGILDKLSDLSWLGDEFTHLSWVEEDDVVDYEGVVKERVHQLLSASDWSMLPDEPLTIDEKHQWIEYRRRLRNYSLLPGYPEDTQYPIPPRQQRV